MKDLVSIVVAMYNSSECIIETIERLVSQIYRPIEIILVDDGSTDNTFSIVRDLSKKFDNVYCYRKTNGGVASARNFGIGMARGQYIAFCDHDDLWAGDKLAKQIPLFEEDAKVGVVYSNVRLIDNCGNVIVPTKPKVAYEGSVFEKLILDNFIPFSSAVVRSSCLKAIGLFCEDRDMHGADDRNLWTRIAHGFEVRCLHEALVDIVLHGSNYSLQEDRMLVAGLKCLDDIWSRVPDVKTNNRALFKRSYGELYFQYGRTLFWKNDFRLARECMLMTGKFQPLRLPAYLYLVFSLLPLCIVNSIRVCRRRVMDVIATGYKNPWAGNRT